MKMMKSSKNKQNNIKLKKKKLSKHKQFSSIENIKIPLDCSVLS